MDMLAGLSVLDIVNHRGIFEKHWNIDSVFLDPMSPATNPKFARKD